MATKKSQDISLDHDLLIQVNTKLERVISDIQELKDNVSSRVFQLEEGKVDKKEYVVAREDTENRIRSLEKWKWGIVGAVLLLQVLIPVVLKTLNIN